MTAVRASRSFARRCLFAFLTLAVAVVTADGGCDKTKCPGPLHYYEGLGCTPVYKNPGDCCAERYNCDHLKERSTKKCYVNGHAYDIGETLKEEDGNPCDIGCFCREGPDGIASFVCAIVDCFHGPVEPECYMKNSPTQCCPGPKVCPKTPEERATCEVDGKIYKDGEYFTPKSNPELECYCMPDYKGENVEPFCAKPKRPYCQPDFKRASEVHSNCAPVYYSDQPPQTSCSLSTRCQNSDDVVIHNHDTSKSGEHEHEHEHDEMTCNFGNLKMHLNDELNMGTDYSSVCVKCLCEVPPVPTCQRLPDSECDVTKHKPFDNVRYVTVPETKA